MKIILNLELAVEALQDQKALNDSCYLFDALVFEVEAELWKNFHANFVLFLFCIISHVLLGFYS